MRRSRGTLRPTWVSPSLVGRYRREGGPWTSLTLDALLSSNGGVVVDGTTRLSREMTEELVARVAGGLVKRGVRRGECVAWQLPNSLAALILYRACFRIGAIATPVLHTLGTSEAEAALSQVDPALIVDIDRDDASSPEALLDALGGDPVSPGAFFVAPSDLAVVLFTSGSTGTPKAVLHSERALSYKARLMARVHSLTRHDAVLMPAPLAHISGLLNGVLLPGGCGMKSVLMKKFDPERALALVADERVSFLAGPPTFFVAMSNILGENPDANDVSSVRLISSGGASVTPAFVEGAAAAFSCRVKRTYGSTEAPTITTSTHEDPFDKARDTDGRAVGEAELRITDPETQKTLAVGESGELWLRGPELFCGYAQPSQNEAVTARGGWFRTGDVAKVDESGWLSIVGRLKDVIIRGGENISASEVEAILESHPGVRQAVAVGYPDDLMGERVAAFVVANSSFTLEDCVGWFNDRRVARFKTPERVFSLDALPLLGSGKPDRGALRKLAVSLAR